MMGGREKKKRNERKRKLNTARNVMVRQYNETNEHTRVVQA